jgi:hypothetical protein
MPLQPKQIDNRGRPAAAFMSILGIMSALWLADGRDMLAK